MTMSAYKGTSDAWVNCTDLWDLNPYLDVANGDATLVIMPYSRSAVWAENMKEQLVPAWNDPSTMADTCKTIAASMNEALAQEQQ